MYDHGDLTLIQINESHVFSRKLRKGVRVFEKIVWTLVVQTMVDLGIEIFIKSKLFTILLH